MKSARPVSIILIWTAVFAVNLRAATDSERSISPSRQFVIYGGEAAVRGAISALAERTKSNVLGILQRHDEWTTGVVINLQSRAANVPEIPDAALQFSQTGSGLKLQLDLVISREMNVPVVEREILRAILLEMIYRTHPEIRPGESYVDPPAWLLDGLLALAPNRDRTALVDALSASGKTVPLQEFLSERPELMDPVGRTVYRAYSFVLLQVLAEEPARLGRYIDAVARASNEPLKDLQKAFPSLAGNEFEKLWAAKVAAVRDTGRADLLTFSQTDEKLSALLQTKFPAVSDRAKSIALEEVCRQKLSLDQKRALKKFGEDLLLLAAQANPMLRPVIQDYHRLAAQLAIGKTHGVAKKLGELNRLRERLAARMSEVDDYMNWFEATQLQTSSGLFDDIVPVSPQNSSRPRRKDAFSTYLDAMEQQF